MMFGPKDPFPNFMPQWTHAIVFIHTKCKKEIKAEVKSYEARGILPIRSKDVIIGLISKKFKLSYVNGASCLIGEAHRFKDTYTHGTKEERCRECNAFCFGPAAEATQSIKELYDFKRNVMEHFKKEHPSISMVGQCNG